MRHRLFLTTALLTSVLILSACAEAPQSDIDTTSPSVQSASSSPQKTERVLPKTNIEKTVNDVTPEGPVVDSQLPALPASYNGLSPKDITRAEIDEHIALKKEQRQLSQPYRTELTAWNAQDRAIRGPRPRRVLSPRMQEINTRLQTLNSKVQSANIRKKYENMDQTVLSKEEIEELITLEQEQLKFIAVQQRELFAWHKQDPVTRGDMPEFNAIENQNPRLQELQRKIQATHEVNHIKERLANLSTAHNINFSDSEMAELKALQEEQQKAEVEFTKVMMDLQKTAKLNDPESPESDLLNKIPKHLIQRMLDAQQRLEAIEAPLKAAEKADRIQKQMTLLSEKSGVTVLSGEIAETIALNAEKDRIQKKTQTDAIQKWLTEGGPISQEQPLPTPEDYARLKEIDARLKVISAPMNEAINTVQEASNPALRQRRLDREKREKWTEEWQDRKQAGDVPVDAPLRFPTYAEIQDKAQDYRAKLKTRSDKIGYAVPEADIKRLETLNEEMMAIRKKVYDMESDPTVASGNRHQGKPAVFDITAGMFKVRLIEQKQREILAGLSAAEATQRELNSNAGGARQFNQNNHVGTFAPNNKLNAEHIIEKARKAGKEVSQSAADDLRAFERALQDK